MKIRKYGHGGMMSDNGKLAIMIKTFLNGGKLYEHGGEFHDAEGNPTNEKGERIPEDPLVAVASDAERRTGRASAEGAALTGRPSQTRGSVKSEQQIGSTIATPEQAELMTQGTGEGTIASFNTEPISEDMSQDQFELAMQSPFVAKQFKGMDIQNPQQLAEAYEGFKSQAVRAIRENEEGVANAARELAETNDNFRTKLETLGDNPTDKEIADLMVQQNTDGLLGDLHGAVVDQFLPEDSLTPTKVKTFGTQYYGGSPRFQGDAFTAFGQDIKSGDRLFVTIQDTGIASQEGLKKLFQDATAEGVDLTKSNKNTANFLRSWYENPENSQYSKKARGAEAMNVGGTGIQDLAGQPLINSFLEGFAAEESKKLKDRQLDFDKTRDRVQALEGPLLQEQYRKLATTSPRDPEKRKKIEAKIQEIQNEIKGLKQSLKDNPKPMPTTGAERAAQRQRSKAMGGKFKVLKRGGRAPMGALSRLFRR